MLGYEGKCDPRHACRFRVGGKCELTRGMAPEGAGCAGESPAVLLGAAEAFRREVSHITDDIHVVELALEEAEDKRRSTEQKGGV